MTITSCTVLVEELIPTFRGLKTAFKALERQGMRCCSREHYGRVTNLSADRPVLAALQVGATASALTLPGASPGNTRRTAGCPAMSIGRAPNTLALAG